METVLSEGDAGQKVGLYEYMKHYFDISLQVKRDSR